MSPKNRLSLRFLGVPEARLPAISGAVVTGSWFRRNDWVKDLETLRIPWDVVVQARPRTYTYRTKQTMTAGR